MMYKHKILLPIILILFVFASACTGNKKEVKEEGTTKIAKGLYAFGPELKTFTRCEDGREYWVADSAQTLELAYSQLGFEKPYVPVYVELEYHYIKTDTVAASANYDSTMVVTKLLKISKDIPKAVCD